MVVHFHSVRTTSVSALVGTQLQNSIFNVLQILSIRNMQKAGLLSLTAINAERQVDYIQTKFLIFFVRMCVTWKLIENIILVVYG